MQWSQIRNGKNAAVSGAVLECARIVLGIASTQYYIQKSGRDFKTEEKWKSFVQKSRGEGNFDKKNAITCYVCDGHFTEDSFVGIQILLHSRCVLLGCLVQ